MSDGSKTSICGSPTEDSYPPSGQKPLKFDPKEPKTAPTGHPLGEEKIMQVARPTSMASGEEKTLLAEDGQAVAPGDEREEKIMEESKTTPPWHPENKREEKACLAEDG